jgi:hypothetical protein
MMRRLIFVLFMLGAGQAHAGLFVFSGGDGVPFKLSFDRLEAVNGNRNAVVRLSLRIDEVFKAVKSAGIRCNSESPDGGKWSFSGEIADLKVGEAMDVVLNGAPVKASAGAQWSLVRCDVINPLLAM